MSDPIKDRFEAYKHTENDSDWLDVIGRADLRPSPGRRWTLALLAAAVALALPAIGLGLGGVLPFFSGKPAPARVVKIFDSLHRGFARGMDPGVIANQTRQVLDVDVPGSGRAVLWVAPTHGGGFCDLLEWSGGAGGGCADHPLGFRTNVWSSAGYTPPAAVINGATDLPGATTIRVDFQDGERVDLPLVWVSNPISTAFFVYAIPREYWRVGHGPSTLSLRDADGNVLALRDYGLDLPTRLRNAPAPPYRRANEQPLQHGEAPGATLGVYASGLVQVRFTSTNSGPYAFLAPKVANAPRHTVTIECAHLSYDSRWHVIGGGTYADFGPKLQAVVSTPSVPFDECSVRGHYGRRWDEHVGYHNAVEVPFNPLAERFFAEQAAARRLAYFVRSPKMREIRSALRAGGTAPSSAEIAARFDESVVALSARDEMPPPGKVGVWSDGQQTIVTAERADDGRRMWVELPRGKRGPNNLARLAFVF
jgi:hypothetical protein